MTEIPYEMPQIVVFDVRAEKGFADSGSFGGDYGSSNEHEDY